MSADAALLGQLDVADPRAPFQLDGLAPFSATVREQVESRVFFEPRRPRQVGEENIRNDVALRFLIRSSPDLDVLCQIHRACGGHPPVPGFDSSEACPKTRVKRQVGALGQAEPTKMHRRGGCSALDDRPRSRRLLGFVADKGQGFWYSRLWVKGVTDGSAFAGRR